VNTEQRLLVAVDVDGTLLDTEFDDVLGKREVEALQAVRRAGHELALCTGRNTRSLGALLEQSGWHPADLPLVLLNGALVWGGQPRRQLVCNVLDGDLIRDLVPLFRDHGTVALVYGTDEDGGVVHHESRQVNPVLERYLAMRSRTVGAIRTCGDLLEIPWQRALEVGTIDTRERIMALSGDIQRRLGDRAAVINTRSLLGGGEYYWAEVYRAGSDKGTGVKALAAACGIAHDKVVALGDNYNDLAMFAVAGCSVAMAGSPDEVRRQADLVAGPVAEGGAAEVLENIAAGTFPPGDQVAEQGNRGSR